MNSRIKALVVLLCVFCAWHSPAQTSVVSGVLLTNRTLSGTNVLMGTVVVTNGVVLTIEPGTQMLMSNAASLVVYGQLLVDGTPTSPVQFTRAVSGQTWNRIRFVRAQPSRFLNCSVEFANSEGDHQNYYPTNCQTFLGPSPRAYTEAIVALATHLDFDGCRFQNLPNTSTNAAGDAIAIISDDPQFPGAASAVIRNCRFQSIGQAIHSRFSYLLVEYNTFADKRGDNDEVDMYGESAPVPRIRRNLFLAGHEDKINPTRCSAIIEENIVIGSDDHGIVLRDRGNPVVVNNIIYNCQAAAISVQNTCDALIANNTMVNCGRAVRLFDHVDRHRPRYCLTPGSGRATVVNNVIWDCPTPFDLADSTNGLPHSYLIASYNNIEGGQAGSVVQPNSTLVWGPGNMNVDPRFVGAGTNNYQLGTNSPCIDAGTNAFVFATNLTFVITNDLDGIPRGLDGNGDGTARFDIGAHELLLATADSNRDGIPDGWTWQHGLNPGAPEVAAGNPDGDAHTTQEEWVADTNPVDPQSLFEIASVTRTQQVVVSLLSSSNRLYTLHGSTNLVADPAQWLPVTGQANVRGTGGALTLNDSTNSAQKFYRVEVRVP